MDMTHLLLIGVVILVTHFVSAITGYGSNLLAMPLLIMLTGDMTLSVLTLLIIGSVQAYHIALYTYKSVDWRELSRMLIGMGIGLPIGVVSAKYLPKSQLLVILGLILIISGVSKVRGNNSKSKLPQWFLNSMLLAGGLIHGAFVCGGAALVVYAQQTFKTKETFRGTLCMIWVILNTALLITRAVDHSFTAAVGRVSLISLPFVLLGNWAGEHASRRIEQNRFMQAVAILLIFAGIMMITREIVAICAA